MSIVHNIPLNGHIIDLELKQDFLALVQCFLHIVLCQPLPFQPGDLTISDFSGISNLLLLE